MNEIKDNNKVHVAAGGNCLFEAAFVHILILAWKYRKGNGLSNFLEKVLKNGDCIIMAIKKLLREKAKELEQNAKDKEGAKRKIKQMFGEDGMKIMKKSDEPNVYSDVKVKYFDDKGFLNPEFSKRLTKQALDCTYKDAWVFLHLMSNLTGIAYNVVGNEEYLGSTFVAAHMWQKRNNIHYLAYEVTIEWDCFKGHFSPILTETIPFKKAYTKDILNELYNAKSYISMREKDIYNNAISNDICRIMYMLLEPFDTNGKMLDKYVGLDGNKGQKKSK